MRLWQDLRYGARMLMKPLGFALIAVLTLTLIIGENTAAFGVINPIEQKVGSLTLKPIVFEVRDKQKVEAESGQLLVPEKRGNQQASMIALAFIRFKSTAQKPAAPIVYLAGGPGDSGINDFRGIPLSLLNDLRAIADVIALDQRGTGASEPRDVTCRYEETLPFDQPGDPELYALIFRELPGMGTQTTGGPATAMSKRTVTLLSARCDKQEEERCKHFGETCATARRC